jgi:hypothetical protein
MKTIVPHKYGNKYFDLMEAPIECWPAMTQVHLAGGGRPPEGQIVEIPTAEVWCAGDFVARRYACTPFWNVERCLAAHGFFGFTSFGIVNGPNLEAEGESPQIAPPIEHTDADPGL